MANSVLEHITGFNKEAQQVYYTGSKTAVLRPDEKMFTPNFAEIKVREITVNGGAGNYSKTAGYDNRGGNIDVKWKTYTCDNDRYFEASVDALDEVSSYLKGTEPSILAGFKAFINQKLAAEVDAVTMARAYSASMEAGNKLETSTFKQGFFKQSLDIKNIEFNKGVDSTKKLYYFVRSDIYTSGEQEIIEKNGLANGAVLTAVKLEIPTGNASETLEIVTEAIKLGNIIFIKMPDERMGTTVELLDGESEGQEAGGFVAGETKMSCVVVPEGAMFNDVRYCVSNMTVPASVLSINDKLELDAEIKKFLGDFRIENIGVDQRMNGFSIKARIVYDAKAYNIHKDKILCFTEA